MKSSIVTAMILVSSIAFANQHEGKVPHGKKKKPAAAAAAKMDAPAAPAAPADPAHAEKK